MNSQRIPWLDIAKAIAIVLMVLGHSSIPKPMSNFIWSFHMPLFFIASGWTTNWGKYGFGDFAKSKLESLCLPFAIYSCIVMYLMITVNLRDPLDVLCRGWEGYALWFIPVLFGALILAKLILSVKVLYIQTLLWMSTVLVGGLLSYYNIQLPWTLCSVPYACFLLILGSKAKQYQDYISAPRWWILIVGFLVAAIVSHFYRLDIAWNSITPVTILTLGACAGTAMMFTFSSCIEKYTKYTSRVLQEVGKETYLILAFSQITIVLLNHYFIFNSAIKYAILLVVLVTLKYIKDGVNLLIGKKIL